MLGGYVLAMLVMLHYMIEEYRVVYCTTRYYIRHHQYKPIELAISI